MRMLIVAIVLAACGRSSGPAANPPPRPTTAPAVADAIAVPPAPPDAPAVPATPEPPAPPNPRDPSCTMHPDAWCAAPVGDPCGAHRDVASCRADKRCGGMPYTGESVVACKRDARGFGLNCPTVGCISLAK